MRPRWLAGVLLGKRRTLGNLASLFPERGIGELSEWVRRAVRSVDHLERRRLGSRTLAGQAHPQGNPRRRGCAARAAAAGVDAIVVSNHGGRQLDGATSTIAALPRVVDAVAGRCEVLLDGGIDLGQDVLKATGARRARLPHRQGASLWAGGARWRRRLASALQIIRQRTRDQSWRCAA